MFEEAVHLVGEEDGAGVFDRFYDRPPCVVVRHRSGWIVRRIDDDQSRVLLDCVFNF